MNELAMSPEQEQFVRNAVARRGTSRDQLLPVLQDVQAEYSWISPEVQQLIADLMCIHPVEVHSVVSFYAFLNNEPGGRFRIRLCNTISCELAGRSVIASQLEQSLGIRFGEATADGLFSLEYAACMGMCDQGPALLINDRVYTRVRPENVRDIIGEYRQLAESPVGREAG